jgi:hypothetical protein
MNIIQNNPYRIIGVLANSSERDLQRQKAKINAFLGVGKEVVFETDINILGKPNRQSSDITNAFSSIEQAQKKVINSFFWFINAGHIDETALNYLKEGDKNKAAEIWQKLTQSFEVTDRNFSAFANLGTLRLAEAFENSKVNIGHIAEAITLKTMLIDSSSINKYISLIADETFKVDKSELTKIFAENFLENIKPFFGNRLSISDLLNAMVSGNLEFVKIISSQLTDQPISNIEHQIEVTKKSRNSNAKLAIKTGDQLYINIKEDLALLKTLLGSTNIQYQNLSDKIAKELLQCGIDYFTELKDHNSIDPSTDSMRLMKYANSIAAGSQTKERIKENISGLQEWIDEKPEREKRGKIEADLDFVTAKLERFQKLSDTVSNARDLVVSCKPKLQNMRLALGSSDDFYIKVSTAVVNNAQGMLVTAVNESQENISNTSPAGRLAAIFVVQNTINEALEVTTLMGSFDMSSDAKTRYNSNRQALTNLKNQISEATTPRQQPKSSTGCYIATMAYGDYDHPQVIELRNFRDEILAKNIIGRAFINVYYKYSPILVEKLGDREKINMVIRKALDLFIKIIR